MITVIAARELRSLFVSPLAWVVLAVVQLVLGWLFVIYVWNFEALSAQLSALPSAPGISAMVVAPLLKTASIVLLLVSPLLTMRLVSGERRNATLNLLMSSPLSMTELVLGKYLGMMAFFALLLALVALLPLSLLTGAALDLGLVASGLLGLLLLCSSFAAAGLYMSTLTRTPAVAAVCTFGLLLALWIIEGIGGPGATSRIGQAAAYLSLVGHLDALLRGVFDSRDLAYYALFTATFLGLSIRRLDNLRRRP